MTKRLGYTADEMRAAWLQRGTPFFFNVYRKYNGPPFATREEADKIATPQRLALVRVIPRVERQWPQCWQDRPRHKCAYGVFCPHAEDTVWP